MPELAMNILTGIVIAAVSSWITVQLSLRRFRAEKSWEKKAEAYERVIEALHHAKAFSYIQMKANSLGTNVSDERVEVLREKAGKSWLEIELAADVGSFILSEKAHGRLKKYLSEVRRASDKRSSIEYLDAYWEATNDCLNDIIRMAKNDLETR